METINQLGLVRDEVILVGSAALTLYGVHLFADPLLEEDKKPRPGDVDFVSTLEYASHLALSGLGNSLPVKIKNNAVGRRILKIDSQPLTADIIPHDIHASTRADRSFRKKIATHSVAIDGTDIRVATPEKLHQQLSRQHRLDRKAASDKAMLRRRFPHL